MHNNSLIQGSLSFAVCAVACGNSGKHWYYV